LASLLLDVVLTAASVPAAILIGPMIAAICAGLAGSTRRVRRPVFLVAQGVVGCLVAASVTPALLAEVVRDWQAMLFAAFVTVGASAGIGLFLARFGTMPGSTAAWGTSPGAASAMVLMAQEYGADPRLVATMQYVRVILVVIAASLISRALIGGEIAAIAPAPPTPSDMILGTAACFLIAPLGAWIGQRLRIPAGGLLVPLLLASIANAADLVHVTVPNWLLVVAYGLIGWAIGLQFDRGSLIRSIRALPEMIAAAIAIVALCGAGAWVMMRLTGVSALTAFLATLPGGIDMVAIIALSGGADTPFVMALQAFRLLVVILMGPSIARLVARFARPA
jgi:membrane AbrB-like protein